MLKNRVLVLLAVAATLAASSAFAGVAVVGNPSNGSTLNADQVKDLFLGKSKSLPSGGNAKVVDQADGSATRNAFYTSVVGKSSEEMKAHWSRLVFTGKGTPPESVGDDAAVKAFVAKTPDGVGYISDSAVDGSVKVLFKQ